MKPSRVSESSRVFTEAETVEFHRRKVAHKLPRKLRQAASNIGVDITDGNIEGVRHGLSAEEGEFCLVCCKD